MRIKNYCLVALGLVFSFSSVLKAGAWVKESGKYYTKLSLNQGSERQYSAEPGGANYLEKNHTWSLYGEVGLPLSFPLQMSVYIPYATVERSSTDKSENSVSQGFGDTTLAFRYPLTEVTQLFSTPLNFLLALSLGSILPTTSDKNRFSQIEKRYDEVSAENRHLISGIDRGKSLFSLALESSTYWKALWFSLSENILGSSSGTTSSETVLDLGLGLPYHSWFQLSWTQLVSKQEKTRNTITTKTGASLGMTVFANIALELGYYIAESSDRAWEDQKQISAGLSLRTL